MLSEAKHLTIGMISNCVEIEEANIVQFRSNVFSVCVRSLASLGMTHYAL
jgi:hypothetical protein